MIGSRQPIVLYWRKARPPVATPSRKRAGLPIRTASSGKPFSPMATPQSTAIAPHWRLFPPMPPTAHAALPPCPLKRRAAADERHHLPQPGLRDVAQHVGPDPRNGDRASSDPLSGDPAKPGGTGFAYLAHG